MKHFTRIPVSNKWWIDCGWSNIYGNKAWVYWLASEEQSSIKVIVKRPSIHHHIDTYCQPRVIIVTTILIRPNTRRHSKNTSPSRDFKNTKENIKGRGKEKAL